MIDSKYEKQTEPSMIEKSYAWKTAIGLQAVDGLKPSKYLIELANRNIKGEITFNDVEKLIDRYYAHKQIIKKANIQKANIQKSNIGKGKTDIHVLNLYKAFATTKVFGRSDAIKATGLKATRLSELFGILLEKGIITEVHGHGKGKYKFIKKFKI